MDLNNHTPGILQDSNDPLILLDQKEFKKLIKKKDKKIPSSDNFFDISINNLVLSSVISYKEIMNEIIELFSSNNILVIDDEHIGTLNKFKFILKGLHKIINKDNRLIYVGILLIIIAFFLYFIDISSK